MKKALTRTVAALTSTELRKEPGSSASLEYLYEQGVGELLDNIHTSAQCIILFEVGY